MINDSDPDAKLLRHCAEEKSEAAFAELGRRRVNLVYSVAPRQGGGDASLAEDVIQKVFADLARKAAEWSRRAVLTDQARKENSKSRFFVRTGLTRGWSPDAHQCSR